MPSRSNLNGLADDDGCGCANNLAVRKYSGASVAKTFGVMRPIRKALPARASTAHSLSCSMRNLAIMLLYEKSRQAYAGKTIFEFAFRYKQRRTWPGAHTAHAKLAGGYVRKKFPVRTENFPARTENFSGTYYQSTKTFSGRTENWFLVESLWKVRKTCVRKSFLKSFWPDVSRTYDFADGPITLAAMIMFSRKQGQQVRRMRHLRLVQCPPSGLR